MHRVIGLLVVVVLVGVLGVVGATADPIDAAGRKLLEQLPRVDQLPADANCYCYRLGWEELKGKLAGTATLAAVEEPGVQEFIKEVRRMGQRGDAIGPAFDFMLTTSFQTLVLAGRPLPPGPADEPATMPDTLYSLTVQPSNATDFARQLNAARESFEKSGLLPPVRHPARKIPIGDTEFQTHGEDDQVILSAWDGKTLHLAGSNQAAEWLAASQQSAGEQSLARSPMFQSAVGPLLAGQSTGPVALYYHDLRPLWKRTSGPFYQNLSWRSIESAAGATFVEGKGWRNRHYWKIGENRTGLFAHTKGGTVNQEWLKRIPAEATAFMTGYWDARSFLLSLGGLYRMLSDGDDEDLEGVFMGLQMIQPMLDAVGPRYMYYRVAGKYGAMIPTPLSDMVLVMELKDAAVFQREFDKLMQQAGGGFLGHGTVTLAGQKVSTLNVMFMTMYFTTVGNDFVVTFHPQMMKDALANWAKPGPSVLVTPAWKAASAKLVKDPCFIFYIAPNGFARGIYDRYIPVLQDYAGIMMGMARAFRGFGGRQEPAEPDEKTAGFNVALLPRGSDLARGVTEATILSAHDDGAGVLFDGYAPLLSLAYYWTGAQASLRPFHFGMQSLAFIMQYVAMPAESTGAAAPGPAERHIIERGEDVQRVPPPQPDF